MAPLVHIVAGKQGRVNPSKPSHELLAMEENLPLDTETLDDSRIAEIAKDVLELVSKHTGYHFDEEYMAQHEGAYGISTVTLDTEYNVHSYVMPVIRPTSSGGHVVFGKGDELKKILAITHRSIPIEEAGSQEIGVYMSKFKGSECVLIVPDMMKKHPKLLRALNLETKGDGSDTTTLVSVRLCDTLGLGKSMPRLSTGKFKFLFPGVSLDMSQVKPKGTKRVSEHVPDKASKQVRTQEQGTPAWSTLHKMLSQAICSYDKTDEEYNSKRALYLMARNFFEAYNWKLGRMNFETAFRPYMQLPLNLVLETLGKKHSIRNIIESTVRDTVNKKSLIHDVFDYSHKMERSLEFLDKY